MYLTAQKCARIVNDVALLTTTQVFPNYRTPVAKVETSSRERRPGAPTGHAAMREVHLIFCGCKLKPDFHIHDLVANDKQRQTCL